MEHTLLVLNVVCRIPLVSYLRLLRVSEAQVCLAHAGSEAAPI